MGVCNENITTGLFSRVLVQRNHFRLFCRGNRCFPSSRVNTFTPRIPCFSFSTLALDSPFRAEKGKTFMITRGSRPSVVIRLTDFETSLFLHLSCNLSNKLFPNSKFFLAFSWIVSADFSRLDRIFVFSMRNEIFVKPFQPISRVAKSKRAWKSLEATLLRKNDVSNSNSERTIEREGKEVICTANNIRRWSNL